MKKVQFTLELREIMTEKEIIIRHKISELQLSINYKLKYGYETQQERDLYERLDQILNLIKEIAGVGNE